MSRDYGHRLLCPTLHDEAKRDPNRLFALVAKSNDIADGFHHITFRQISRATNYVSKWLQGRFEYGGKPVARTTLAYIGVPDIRYNIVLYAAIQCRYKLSVPSPRNTPSINASLLIATQCSRLVYANEVESIAKQLQSVSHDLECEPFPSIEDLLNVPDCQYLYEYNFDQLSKEPILVLNSSGSTGLPKPILWTHGTLAAMDYREWPSIQGRRNHDWGASFAFSKYEARLLDFFPPFHAAGIMFKVLMPVFNLTVPIFGPALGPPSGALAAQIIRDLKPHAMILPSSIGEQLVQEPDSERLFRSLEFVMYGGGPMPKEVGSKITSWTTLIQAFASTEVPQIRQLVTQPEDWEYIEFHPNERVELQPRDDDLFEMVFHMRPEFERDFATCHILPNLSEWHTRDLFRRHPEKPDLWKFYGRLDDVIVFSSGEKLYPLPLEMALMGTPGITGALVVGQGYPQAALLLEVDWTKFNPQGLRRTLWPAVETANALLPAHGRIAESMILIADPERPFKRAPKGSIVRKLTQELYAENIRNLFVKQAASQSVAVASFAPSSSRLDDIKTAIRSILQHVSMSSQISDDDNLYSYGMNSLKTAEAVNYTKSSLQASIPHVNLDWLSMETFYHYPTISGIASVLLSYLNDGILPVRQDRVQQMQTKIEQYMRNLPISLGRSRTSMKKTSFSIMVTGTTGFLGPHLLAKLCQLKPLSRVYCLNRSPSAQESFKPDSSSSKLNPEVIFMRCNFAEPNLGLTDQDYARLLEDCDLILHNAWTVNFNLPLDSFADNLESVRQLVQLSASAANRPRIVFISTIAATIGGVMNDQSVAVVPEQSVRDLSTSMEMGYAESKRVAECMLEGIATQLGIPTTIIRLGYVVPAEDGRLPDNDLLTSFLRTCKGLGLVASDFANTVNWLRVSDSAQIIAEVVKHDLQEDDGSKIRFLNLVNPSEKQWSELLDGIDSWSAAKLKHVSLHDWIEALKEKDPTDIDTIQEFPALRMIDSLDILKQGSMALKCEQQILRTISPTLSKLSAIDTATFESWLRHL